MDQRLYITHLSGKTTELELNSWLEKRIGETCSTSLKKGKIPGTHIAFVSIGNYDADKAIAMLNNSQFLDTHIRVQRYIQTERNKSYNSSAKRFNNETGPPSSTFTLREKVYSGTQNASKTSSDHAPSQPQPSPPTSYSGAMVFVTSSSEFYVQEVSDLQTLKIINSYMDLLDRKSMCETNGAVDISIGRVCAARYAFDDKFYRAIILSEENKGTVEVQFVDFGNKETVKRESLVSLPDDIAKQEFVAKRCCFHQLKTLNEEKFVNFLREAGEKFNIALYHENSASNGFRSWEVDLLREANKESLRQELIDHGFAKLEAKKEPSIEPKTPSVNQNGPELLSNATCIISHVESCERFFLQGAYGQSHLAEIYQCLLTATSLPEIKIADANPSKIYAAVFSKDRTWYRCRLRDGTSSTGSGEAPTVYFIDFGNSESLNGDMRILPEVIATIPPQAVLCQLPELRMANPVKVKNELIGLGNNEVPLKCHLQQIPGCEAVSVDFAVEGKFPSFCSWVIENRWAERIYKHKAKPTPPSTSNSTPRFVPSQVARRQTMEPPSQSASAVSPGVSSSGGRKRTGPRSKSGPVRNANYSPRSIGTDSGTDSGERHSEVLRSELVDAVTYRQMLENWRDALCHGEKSLVQKLSVLRKLKGEGDIPVVGEDIATFQRLIALRNATIEMRAALNKEKQDVRAALDNSEDDLFTAAAKRDAMAKELVDCIQKFLNELSSCGDLLKKHSTNAEILIKKIEFLLNQCSIRRISEANGHADVDKHCEKIWDEYESSPFFEQKLTETEICSKQLEEVREVLGQVTGVFVPKGQDSAAIVTSFFEKLKALNNAMSQEVNAYTVHFLSGSNGEMVTDYLERHLTLALEFKEAVRQLEQDCNVARSWDKEVTCILQGLKILTDGTIESLEEMAAQRKKARSKLRHLLADLEDEEESGNGGTQQLIALKHSIAEVRCELHTILERESEIKKSISDALELRPELSIQMKKNLKVDTSLMDDTGIISSWETSYFDLVPVESEANCFFSSKYKDQDVFIQKVLLTADSRSSLEEILRRYQQVASSSSSLAPLLAAFVPPRDNHVVYLVSPGLELVREIVSSEAMLKISYTLLSALSELRTKDICFSMFRPMQFLGRMTLGGEDRFVLLPNFNMLDGNTEQDLFNIIDVLSKETLSRSTPSPALEKILKSISSLADIPEALSRITNLLQMLTSPIKVCDHVESAEAPTHPEFIGDVTDDVDMDLNEDEEVINGNGVLMSATIEEPKDDEHFTPIVVVEKVLDDSSD